MSKLKSKTIQISELSDDQKEIMWQLMDINYANANHPRFLRDLSEKDHVIILEDLNSERIVGFSTVKIILTSVSEKSVCAVFSGDTIIDPLFWGEQGLTKEFGKYLINTFESFPESYCCWFLISKGYKTYRYLPLYFNEFFPRFNKVTPKFEQEVLNALAEKKYPGLYDSDSGIIRLNGTTENLREGIADITDDKLRNPHVSFFVEKNPGYIHGDELACIAELSNDNLKTIFFRIVSGK